MDFRLFLNGPECRVEFFRRGCAGIYANADQGALSFGSQSEPNGIVGIGVVDPVHVSLLLFDLFHQSYEKKYEVRGTKYEEKRVSSRPFGSAQGPIQIQYIASSLDQSGQLDQLEIFIFFLLFFLF